ncbi:MAG: discoidin domain-containing protein [Acidobacteria bacterium]|nr:discoidin domain-containing protein [Acidobacteriota bacterium]
MRQAAVWALLVLVLLIAAPLAAQTRTLDDFETIAGWTAAPSDGVRLDLSWDQGALRLDFDFHGGAGYAVAHKAFDLDLPANWEISFRIRAEAPVNNLEFKLIDPTGENVWWINRKSFQFPREWREVKTKKRQIEFAWGPVGGGEMKKVAAIEFAVTAGTGGKGTVWIDDLTFTELPPEHPYSRTPAITISADSTTYDFLEPREYGGLVIDWDRPTSYAVEISDDGKAWTTVREVKGGNGGRDYLYLPETESRYLRLRGAGAPRNVDVKPLAWAPSINAFFERIAKDAPRGSYPRSFSGEQEYWTVVGADGDSDPGLLGEDGALEVGKGAFSIEPFLFAGGELISWANVETAQTLADGYLPIPTVTWTRGDLSLEITALVSRTRYLVRNRGKARRLRLYLAIRPFQVNPPTQFLNDPGGASSIREIAWDGRVAIVNGARRVIPEIAPAAFGATTFDGGEISEHLRQGRLPGASRVSDPFGYASGAFEWNLDIPAGGEKTVDVLIPRRPKTRVDDSFPAALAAASRDWHERLDRVELHLPPAAEPLVRTFRTAIAHILISRDGPALRPGVRSYARTWIRDGALISSALLRAGHAAEVRELIEWFAPYQFPSGKVPCCVDARGADPVPENDSHGEFVFLVAEYWRYTGDTALVEKVWPHVEKAVAYVDELRRQRRTDEYRQTGKLKFFGLLPESISHEGYSAHPVHSYWDDFFALKGLKDAVDLATALGRTDEVTRWAASRDELRTDLYTSLNRVIAGAGIDYVPGSADLADFDATSTTIALSPGGELANLPHPALEHTFERYWREFEHRRSATDWKDYTPYELRTVGAFLRLGWTDRAHQLLDFFLKDRRPPGWNQWPEVVRRDPRAPGFLGDLPHTWVGSDFVRSFLDLLAYERDSDHALVLAAGVPDSWIASRGGVIVRRLPTPWGLLDYSLAREGDAVRLRVGGGLKAPPGGIVYGETVIRALPADLRVARRRRQPSSHRTTKASRSVMSSVTTIGFRCANRVACRPKASARRRLLGAARTGAWTGGGRRRGARWAGLRTYPGS